MEHSAKQQVRSTSAKPSKQPFFSKRAEPVSVSPITIQPKLTIGPVDDPFEREADAMADKVMRMSASDVSPTASTSLGIQRKCSSCEEEEKLHRKDDESEKSVIQEPVSKFAIQRKCSHCEEEEKEEPLHLRTADCANRIQRKCAECEQEEELHRKESSSAVPSVTPSVYLTVQSAGTPLDHGTRSFMESRFSYDFSNVRIHNDSLAHQSSADINALAYTHGEHIVFGAGRYQPDSIAGKQLLAHELTHVVQHDHNKVRRQSNPVKVPPTEKVEEWVPDLGKEYLWKNPDLRKIIYPQRDDSLRAFLDIVKGFELKGFIQGSQDVADAELIKMLEADKKASESQVENFKNEKTTLQQFIETEKKSVAELEVNKKDATKDLKNLLKPGTEEATINSSKVRIERAMKTFFDKIESAQKNLDFIELRKSKMTGIQYTKEKEVFEKRKTSAIEARDKLLEELAPVIAKYDELITPSEAILAEIVKELDERKKLIKTSEIKVKSLDNLITQATSNLKKVDPLIAAVRKQSESGKALTDQQKRNLGDWRQRQYRTTLSGMDHDMLLKEVIAVFKKQQATGFFPPWMEYLMVHFAGMRYASAHGTWEKNPQELLVLLKDVELNAATDDDAKAMIGVAANELTKTESAKVELPWTKVKKQLNEPDKLLFEKLRPLQQELSKKYFELSTLEKDTDPYLALIDTISTKEKEIEELKSQFTKAAQQKIGKIVDDEKKLLTDLFREKAKKKLRQLSTSQALTLLKKMKEDNQIPDYAWKEIMSFTELRIEMPASDLVEKKDMNLAKVKVTDDVDVEEFVKWKNILTAWHKASDKTAWRSAQAKTLSVLIVTSLVCDQASSVAQHARGLKPGGGLRMNALFYYDLAKGATNKPLPAWDKKTVCPPEPTVPTFKRPSSLEDFPCGASIFWAEWSDLGITKEYQKFFENTERPLLQKIKAANDKKTQLEKSDPKKELPAVEKQITELEAKRKKMLDDRAKLNLFAPQVEKGFIPDVSNIVSTFKEKELQLLETDEPGVVIKDGGKSKGWT